MNESVFTLIKENRKLFYNGQIGNYIIENNQDEAYSPTTTPSEYTEQEVQTKSYSNRIMTILDDFFNEKPIYEP